MNQELETFKREHAVGEKAACPLRYASEGRHCANYSNATVW